MIESSSQAFVQAQDTTGTWRTYSITTNDPTIMLVSMRSLKATFPEYRIRVIDMNGRVLDIL